MHEHVDDSVLEVPHLFGCVECEAEDLDVLGAELGELVGRGAGADHRVGRRDNGQAGEVGHGAPGRVQLDGRAKRHRQAGDEVERVARHGAALLKTGTTWLLHH